MPFSGHAARKRFGQHWLKDSSVLDNILAAADLDNIDRVLEIGPGKGALTERLLRTDATAIHAVEVDRDLVVGLRKRFGHEPRFSLIEGDALSASLKLPNGEYANKVVANIPYNITGPLLERLVGRLGQYSEVNYDLLVLLVQKEVADRILAKPGNSCFSSLSVKIQLLAQCKSVCFVSPDCFSPPPKVQSQVIAIKPLKVYERLALDLEKKVETLLCIAFLGRRKMLRNSLGRVFSSYELELFAKGAGISLEQRPQELPVSTWLELARGFDETSNFIDSKS